MTARRLHLIVEKNKDGYPELLPSFSADSHRPLRRIHALLLVLSLTTTVILHLFFAKYRLESIGLSTVVQYVLCGAMGLFFSAQQFPRFLQHNASASASEKDSNDDYLAIIN
jgi:RsiW-degrading membrane proteinase PrsW (M82 family)